MAREGEPLLTRLLRRRADEPAPPEASPPVATTAEDASDTGAPQPAQSGPMTPGAPDDALPPARVDPHSGRPIDELVDADLPPIESIGPDSDVRAFLGRNISPELRRQALRKLFQQPKFNVVCLCAEYAENYNNFTPMGAIVPHDLKRQIAHQAERLARKALEAEAPAATGVDPATAAAHETAGPGAQSADPREGGEASTKVLSDAAPARPDAVQPAVDKPQRG